MISGFKDFETIVRKSENRVNKDKHIYNVIVNNGSFSDILLCSYYSNHPEMFVRKKHSRNRRSVDFYFELSDYGIALLDMRKL